MRSQRSVLEGKISDSKFFAFLWYGIMYLVFFYFVAAEVLNTAPGEIEGFLQSYSGFKALFFCDFSLDPCRYFEKTTEKYFGSFPFPLGKVDVRSKVDSEISAKYGLKDYPYIIYFRQGDDYEQYQSSLEPIEIHSILLRIFSESENFTTMADLNFALENKYYSDGLLLGLKIDSGVWKEMSKALIEFIPFGHAGSSEIQENFNCIQCIIVFRPKMFEFSQSEKFEIIQNPEDPSVVVNSFYKNFALLTPNNHIFLKKSKPLLVLYAKISPKENPTLAKYVASRYYQAVLPMADDFTIVIGKTDDFQWILEEIGLGRHKNLVMIDDTADIYFIPDVISETGTVKTGKIQSFVEGFLNKTIAPHTLSEPVPIKIIDKGLKVLVGTSIKQAISEAKKDLVLLVYSKFSEDYELAIYLFESISTKFPEIEFAKIDGNKNSIPSDFITYNYPVAFYIKPGYKPQSIEINLENPKRSLESIRKYLRSSEDL